MLVLRYVIICLQLLLLIGAYALKRLYSTKMGVMRYVVMLSNKWHAAFNPELVFACLGLLLIALGLWRIIHLRRKQCQSGYILPWVRLALISFFYLLLIWVTWKTGIHVYVVILPIFGLVLLLQLLQCVIGNKKR